MTIEEKKARLLRLSEKVTEEWLKEQMDYCIQKIEQNMDRFGTKFPSACATNGRYRIKENDD